MLGIMRDGVLDVKQLLGVAVDQGTSRGRGDGSYPPGTDCRCLLLES
jgi:hypothetical protein